MSGQWHVEVDEPACMKSGMCLAVAPGHFAWGPSGYARPSADRIEADEDVMDAALSCMAEAIRIKEVDTGRSLYPPVE